MTGKPNKKTWPSLVPPSRKLRNTYFVQVIMTMGGAAAFIMLQDPDLKVSIVLAWMFGLTGSQTGYGISNAVVKHAPNYEPPPQLKDGISPPPDPIATSPKPIPTSQKRDHHIQLNRHTATDDFTEGVLHYGNNLEFACDTLEDEFREIKVAGETRIPAGEYILGWNGRETDFTKKYRSRFPKFFQWHLELKNVPEFSGIYIHPGNTDMDTAGCPLLGIKKRSGALSNSVQEWAKFYKWCQPLLDAGETIRVQIKNP